MSLIEDIKDELITGGISNSISVATIPETATLPAVVIYAISENHIHHLKNTTGKIQSRIQISCYADRYDDAKSLNESIRLILDALSPSWCDSILIDSVNETYTPQVGQDSPVHQVISDYMILSTVAIPSR